VARPRSHCHAWSAAPTAWLSRYVLGVRVERYRGPVIVEPNPCGLREASGTVPTLYGPVRIAWRRTEAGLTVEVEAPAGAPLDLREPAGFAGRCEYRPVFAASSLTE
jgi:hypothetical protein